MSRRRNPTITSTADRRRVALRCTRPTVLVLPSLFADIEGRPGIERLSDPAPLRFSAAGELLTRV